MKTLLAFFVFGFSTFPFFCFLDCFEFGEENRIEESLSEITFMCDPVSDSLALVDLYNSTNGTGWNNSTNWLVPGQAIGTWYGVTMDANGCVTCIDLEGSLNCQLSSSNWTGNGLSGTIPPELGNLTELVSLDLRNNNLNGSIPPELASLCNLEELGLAGNNLTGNIPSELGSFCVLQNLNLSFNQLDGNIPSELGNINTLQIINLDSNLLSGNIPTSLGDLTNLQILDLAFNQLTGFIPPELGNLTNLTNLKLDANFLSGTIPLELGSLTNLQTLLLSSNQLTGSIPSELGNLTSLNFLNLNSNQLTGSVPPELGSIPNLTSIWIIHNQLTGSVPPELGNNNLDVLLLDNNDLSGCYPDFICDLTLCTLGSNPKLPWGGIFTNFCLGQNQIGAPCDDGDPLTNGEVIQSDCSCAVACPTGTTVTVTNTNDSGSGSLREAIECANNDPTLDNIEFNISGNGPHMIQPVDELPTIIDDGVNISGTASGLHSLGDIILDGALSSSSLTGGFNIQGNNCRIEGLVIQNFPAVANNKSGIFLEDSDNHIIENNVISLNGQFGIFIRGDNSVVRNNKIGTDINGTSANGNDSFGISIVGDNNTIGGSSASDRNIISANGGTGVYFNAGLSNNNIIEGNYIGTDITGVNDLGNGFNGIGTANGITGSGNIIRNNLISGNDLYGISMSGSNMSILTNYIGTDVTGVNALGNDSWGIRLFNATNNSIGDGTLTGENIIAFNGGAVSIDEPFSPSSSNLITRNSIFCNSNFGLTLFNGSNNNIQSPTITSSTVSQISGTAPNNSTIEVFIHNETGCTGAPCQGKTYLGTTTADASGNWTLNAPFNSTVNVGDEVTATATDASNNTSEFSLCATVCIIITANDPNIGTCTNEAVSYDLTQHDITVNGGSGNTVTWYDGDPNNGGTIISNPSNVNLNNVNDLWAEVSDGTCTNTVDVTVTINPQIMVEVIGPTQVDVGSSINLNGVILSGGSGNFTFSWVLIPATGSANLNPTNTQNTTLTGVSPGGVTAEFTVTDDNGCTAFTVWDVEVIDPCPIFEANLTPSTTEICNGSFVNLTFTFSGGSGTYDVTWTGGTGTLLNIPNNSTETVYPTSNTTYSIISVNDSDGCPGNLGANSSTTITVNDNPTASLFANESSGNGNNDNIICEGDVVNFSATGGTLYEFFINGISQGSPSASNGFSSSTLSDGDEISVIVTDGNGCTDETLFGDGFNNEPITITVNELPNLNGLSLFTVSYCEGDNVFVEINAPSLLTGNYTINYDLTGANNAFNQTTNVVINNGAGTIDLGVLPQLGMTTITVNSVTNNDACSSISTGNNTAEFEIFEVIDLSILNITVDDGCLGEDAWVTIQNGPNSGNYDINYSLTGANNISNSFITITFFGGTASFPISSPNLPNPGISTFSIDNWLGGLCPPIGTAPTADFEVFDATISISGDNSICIGESSDIQIVMTGTPPFEFIYSINGNVQSPIVTSLNVYTLTVSPTQNTTYLIENFIDDNQCGEITSASVVITVNEAPTVTNIQEDCAIDNQTYTVTFDILGGDPNSYTVNGSSATSPFTSAPIPNGDSYSFNVDDVNQCGPVNISGLVDCGCATDAGTMNTTLIEVCEDELASAIFNNDQNLDGNDVLNYALHDNPGLSLGSTNVIGLNPEFGFDSNAGFVLGQTYYISSIAGNDNGSGFVDLNDPCLSVSQGTPVIFYVYPNVDLGANQVICPNDVVILDAGNSGMTYNWNTGESTQTIIVEDAGTYTVTVTNAVCSDTDAVTISTSDTEDPILTCPEDVSVTVSAGSMGTNISNLAPEVSDNCGIDLVTFTLSGVTTGSGNDDASGEFFNIGFTELMYEVTDVGGNIAFCFSVIEVIEGIIPCRQIDSVLLVSLFDSLDGANWIYTPTTYWDGNMNLNIPNAGNAWDFSQPIDTWHGVALNTEGCLNKLILNEVGASGSIPVEIGDFTAIEEFYFYENDLTGTIPPEIGNIAGVSILSFANNQLEGGIPPEIGNLTGLVRLDLSNNDLTGEVPNALLNLQNLRDLEIQDNKFTFTHLLHNLDSLESIVNSNSNTPIFDFYDYAPQDSIFQKTNVVLQAGQTFFVDLLIDDTVTTSSYQWYKDDVALVPVLDSNKFEIQNVDASHEGNYWVHVTNPNADSLTLESRCISLTIIVDQCVIESCPENITINCLEDPNDLTITGEPTSNCPNPNFEIEDNTAFLNPCGYGLLFRTFTLVENGIQLGTCNQQIIIADQTPLSVTFPGTYEESILGCPNPLNFEPEDLPSPYNFPLISNDDCEELDISYSDNSTIVNCILTIKRTWFVTNLCTQQVTQADQDIIIEGSDTESPEFPNGCTIPTVCINSNICDTTIILPTPEVMDCDENVQISVTSDFGNDFGPFSNIEPGIYSVEYTATDVCGNQNTCSTQIEIWDCFAPIANCADLTIDLENNNPPSVQIAADQLNDGSSDNCVGPLQFSFSTDVIDNLLGLDCSSVGTQSIQMWVTDVYGNQSICESKIQITDSGDLCQSVGCQVTCQSQIQVSAGGSITFDMVLESDLSLCPNADFVLEIQNQNGQTLDGPNAEIPTNCDYIGQNLTIVLTDNNSGESCSSSLVVVDNVEPNLTCPDETTIIIPVGGNNTIVDDIDAAFSDNCTAELSYTSTNATILSGIGQASGQLFNVGTTEVIYTVTDGFNEVTCMFNVTVENETSACLQSDSLSLVDFYNALTECNNWIVDWNLNEPFKNWEGVFTNQFGCVTGVFLPNNNLCGELPLLNLPNLIFINLNDNQIYGTIPDWELPNLVEFSLANNQLDSMTQMVNFINSAQPFTEIHLENNAFTFDDILPNFGINITGINFIGPPFDLTYHPQEDIYDEITFYRFIGEDFFIDLGIDAGVTSNIYEWFKDGVSWNTFDNNKLEIQGVTLDDAGEYKAQITNPLADQLTLFTKCIRLEVLDPCEGFQPSLGDDFSICQGDTTTLDAGIGHAYLWSTGDTTQTLEVTQSGTYLVTVTNEFGCDRGDEIMISEYPNYTETQEPIICEGESFQVGDSIYTQAGIYTNLFQSEFGCDSSVTTILTVIDLAIDLSNDAVICADDCVDLDATIPNCPDCEYSWSDDPTETSPTRSICPNSDISIVVNVINAQDCEASDTILIQVNFPPDAPDFTGEFSVCENGIEQYNIINYDPNLNYYWTLPTGTSFTNSGDTIVVDFSTFIGGNICLESENNCGLSSQICKSIEVKELPEMPMLDDGVFSVCQDEIVEYCLNSVVNAGVYTWDFPNETITSMDTCLSFEWTVLGSQNVLAFAQNECGNSDTIEFTVDVFERPFAEYADDNLSICSGESVEMIIELSGEGPWEVTYFDGIQNQVITGITQSPHYESVSPSQNATYSLVEISNEYCTETISGNLSVLVDNGDETFFSERICEGEFYEFSGQILTESGEYFDSLVNFNGCDSIVILDLIVNDILELIPETDFFFFPEEENSTLLEVTENDNLPSDGWELVLPETETDLGSLSIENDAIRYDLIQEDFSGIDSFYYEICQIACPENCYSVLVEVSFQVSCVKEALEKLPTAFSPFQLDGINDEFDPLQTFEAAGCPVDPRETTFVVANRWGEVVFKPTRYPLGGWQGQKQEGSSKKLPQGTYYYYLSFPLDGKQIEVQKPIELLY